MRLRLDFEFVKKLQIFIGNNNPKSVESFISNEVVGAC
jgi:hypothetical protein